VLTPADLERDYGLSVSTLREHPGGFESVCFVADGAWFVKVWKHGREPVRLDLLAELRERGLPVPAPLPTTGGKLFAVAGDDSYAVFKYVAGRMAGDGDWAAVADALRLVHATAGVDLPGTTMDEPDVWRFGQQLDHPWVRDRRRELSEHLDRLRAVIAEAKAADVEHVLCHQDFGGFNLLVRGGDVVAIVDWEQAVLGPREHDLWIAAEQGHGHQLLRRYGAYDLDLNHLEYALLARALRDMAARVTTETDRPGVDTWGFRRLQRLERDLDLFRPFCR
jgi:spectinomycin phosphotransferase